MSMAIVNVPLFLCLRRTSLLFVLVAEFYVLHKVPSRLTQCVLTVIGMTATTQHHYKTTTLGACCD